MEELLMRLTILSVASTLTGALAIASVCAVTAPAQGVTGGSHAVQHEPGPVTAMANRLRTADLARRRTPGTRAITTLPRAAAARDTFAVPGGPIMMAVSSRTKTLYVVTITGTISLVNVARCNRRVDSGCKVVASVPGRAGYQDAVIDPSTHTMYALFGGLTGRGHTVEVFNAARCNVGNRSDCRAVATVQVGRFPIGATLDRATHTLYVSNSYSNTVSMINTATCNAMRRAGCHRRPRAVRVGRGPNLSDLDQAVHTLYVPNSGPGGANGNTGSGGTTVSLIDTATCNATRHTGCRAVARTATIGSSPFGVTIAAGTVYAWDDGGLTAALINTATCNATRLTSCHRAKRTVGVGADSGPGASDPRTHTVYAVDSGDDLMSVIDSATCNARHPARCPARAPVVVTGQEPASVLIDSATDTAYVANIIDNTVSVLNGAACNAMHRAGCRKPPVAIALGGAPGSADVDLATHTVYVANQLTGKVQIFNAATCRAGHPSGCHVVATVTTGTPGAHGSDTITVAVNQATDTIYAVNAGEGSNSTVRVINGATCNSTDHSGCGEAPATIDVGKFPIGIGIDEATDTVYVANTGSNTISVINGATCNGTDQSDCGQNPPTMALTGTYFAVAVNQATDTIYVSTANNTLAVFNGATCNATDTSGCGQTPDLVTVGNSPQGVGIDEATDTVYVANNAGGDSPASVSVINGATCDGTDHAGCGQIIAPAARGAFGLAVDQVSDKIVVAGFNDASVSILDGATCNAADTAGCGRMQEKKPAGSGAFWVAVDSATSTAYVEDFNDSTLAVISIAH
jgi:YVTN family beta-propeller protein